MKCMYNKAIPEVADEKKYCKNLPGCHRLLEKKGLNQDYRIENKTAFFLSSNFLAAVSKDLPKVNLSLFIQWGSQ